MTVNNAPNQYDPNDDSTDAWAGGISLAAAALLIVAGFLAFFQGIAAVANDDYLLVETPEYIYAFNLTTWGWIHIVIGIIAVIVAIGIFAGQAWGRICGIIIACLSLIANFLWLPYTPWWSIIIIIIDVIVIWALATWKGNY